MEHFKDGERGFSIKMDGPLDMRFDQEKGETAHQYLMRIAPEELVEQLQKYGDFRYKRAESIAFHITKNRYSFDFTTTHKL